MQRKESISFILVGLFTAWIDYQTYTALLAHTAFGLVVAKGLGFMAGTLCAYAIHRFITFARRPSAKGSLFRFLLLYGTAMAINTTVNALCVHGMLAFFPEHFRTIAFLMASTASALWNYLGLKRFAFRMSKTTVSPALSSPPEVN